VPEGQITEADVERLLHGFELYNAGDFEALRGFVSADFVVERVGGEPPAEGWDAVKELIEPDAFEWQRMYALDWELNGDKGLVHVRIHAKGAGSGIELDIDGWQVWTVRDGMAIRLQNFLDEADAREAAGLP
jgi:ketosteroid isomerase-like protein